ncbi:MAG: CHAD domain-containing protein [Phycisphaeraceae bacterium]|nr:CHAD domain-containing protein [Phycisphaeraceae bacterium]MCB9847740.1 CHAD domain-containing protein [Phycisphaeraceae bacterium]
MTKPRRSGRWIVELDPAMSAPEAARVILDRRFDTIDAALSRAIDKAGDEPDALRKLRVATRRGAEAISAMAPAIGAEQANDARRTLRKIRRAAADTRACDLVMTALRRDGALTADKRERAAAEYMIEQARRRRREEFGRLLKSVTKQPGKLRERREALLGSITGHDGDDAISMAELASGVFSQHARALGDIAQQSTLDDPHRLRVALKKLKYTIELFAHGASEHDALLDSHRRLASIQDLLGEMNDNEEIAAWVARVACSAPASEAIADGLRRLIGALQQRAERQREAVRLWWSDQGGRGFVEAVAHDCAARVCGDLARGSAR